MFRSMTAMAATVAMIVCVNVGCTPRTLVIKNPGPKDCGVRYYRPKPYLMVKPAVDKEGKAVAGYVSIETTTLPDFSEEYSIHVRSGLGINNTSITLEDGWNLTALNVNIDSQVDETLKSVAEVAKAIPTGGLGVESTSRIDVKGVNVPFGLYEAVVSRDGCTKRLYGFRYVGFMPFSSCPVEVDGCHPYPCEGAPIYGLVFDQEENVMVFKALAEIPGMQADREVIPVKQAPIHDDPNQDTEDNSSTSAVSTWHQ